jgi:UDP-N-acetylglucosamine 2-epimerase
VKAAVVTSLLRLRHQEVLVHTGQHYDEQLSDIFFSQLDLPQPDYHLGVGSASHGKQVALVLSRLEEVLMRERPERVLVYGDTNSTLGAALATAKLHLPLAHVEAGLRNYNRRMPEEVNRVITDHCADMFFCPTQTAVDNLAREGIAQGVYLVGDVMYDSLLYYVPSTNVEALEEWGVRPQEYAVITVHRPANTDVTARLNAILKALERLAFPIIFPAHPRARKAIVEGQLSLPGNVRLVEPLGYRDMLLLERYARCILTDSGGQMAFPRRALRS